MTLPSIDATIQFIKRSDVHGTKEYKKGMPYYEHPIKVMARLPVDASIELKHAALLHDVLEDTGYSRQMLLDRGYSDKVLDIVAAVTNVKPSLWKDNKPSEDAVIAWYKAQIQSVADGTKVIGKNADETPRLLKDDPDTHRGAMILKRADIAENRAPENNVDVSSEDLAWFTKKRAGTDRLLADGLRTLEAARGQGGARCAC